MGGSLPKVKKCHVEPMNIVWEYFHLKDRVDVLRAMLLAIFMIITLTLAFLVVFLVSV